VVVGRCLGQEHLPEILGHGDLMRASHFNLYGRRMYQGHVSHFIVKGDVHIRGASPFSHMRDTPS
jgi:hypothetical protein